jgi:YD repeat-containing protein
MQVPAGYTRVREEGATIVARDDALAGMLAAYRAAPSEARSLHGFASRVHDARRFQGRDVAYAITLPQTGIAVVVRHNRHGGLLRSITGDVFAGGSRTEMELLIARGLAKLGVTTPEVVGYALYPAFPGFVRSDVLTEEIPDSRDLGNLLLETPPDSEARQQAWDAAARLLRRLRSAHVRHHDLNVKNVLLRDTQDGVYASYLLDVDRVEFGCNRTAAARANVARLIRSVEKWRDTRGAKISAAEIETLRHTATSIP